MATLPSATNPRALQALQRARRKRQASPREDPRWHNFQAYPSCPPSSVLHISGGWISYSCYLADAAPVYIPPQTLDLAIPSDTLFVDWVAFSTSQSGQYTAAILLVLDWQPVGTYGAQHITEFYIWGTSTTNTLEIYSTATEAESRLDRYYSTYLAEGIPICNLVLRNNGTTGAAAYCYEPLSISNRGGSYIYHNLNWRGRCVA